jgi:hypothetical protein
MKKIDELKITTVNSVLSVVQIKDVTKDIKENGERIPHGKIIGKINGNNY